MIKTFEQKQQLLKGRLGKRYNPNKHDLLCIISESQFTALLETLEDEYCYAYDLGVGDFKWDSQDLGHLNP